MPSYTVEVPEAETEERGVRVSCDEHGECREFAPGYRTVAYHCERCGYEVEISVHDLLEWRDLGERC